MSGLKLIHVSPWVRTTGGVETLLRRHAQKDAAFGFEAKQVALFDRGQAREERYTPHGFTWRSTLARMRHELGATLAAEPGAIVLWHNAWGLPLFADRDAASRRIACLWDGVGQFGPWLGQLAGLVDGVTCMSEAAARDVRRILPDLPPQRVAVLPVQISPPTETALQRPPRREWVIGCGGRLVRGQKRWDRLVPFVEELRRQQAPYRIEVVSDGPLRGWLERRLGADPSIAFLGWQSPEDYWRRLANWDVAVFFSDHEGGPIVLLEAMAAGVVPFYPTIGGSVGDDYAAKIDPRCYYPAGDPVAAARAVSAVLGEPEAERMVLRGRARELAQRHEGAGYEEAFAGFVRQIAAQPRISRPPTEARGWRWPDFLPLGLITRVLPHALWR